MWSFEFSDIVSHLLVCIVYASNVESNEYTDKIFNTNDTIIGVYFGLFLIDLLFNFIPLYVIVYLEPKSHKLCDKYGISPLGDHVFILDLITDVPMFFITFFAKTYQESGFIIFDLVWKAVLFVRALYIMCIVNDNKYYSITHQDCTKWDYTLETAKNEHKNANNSNDWSESLLSDKHGDGEVDLRVKDQPEKKFKEQHRGFCCLVLVLLSAVFGYVYTDTYSIKQQRMSICAGASICIDCFFSVFVFVFFFCFFKVLQIVNFFAFVFED